MRKKQIIMLMVPCAALLVGATIYLAPSSKEVTYMQMQDANYTEAMKLYSALYAQGDHSVGVLAALINLHIYYGNVDKAIALLEHYVAKHPDSMEAQRQLAGLYKSSQRLYAYCRTLETVEKLQPSATTLRELADTYDFLGQYAQEMNALTQLVRMPGYKPREEDYVALASFYRINHQLDDAASTLYAFVDYKHSNVNSDTLYLAAQLLLEKGDERKALSIASGYLEKHPKEQDAVTFSSLFQQRGKLDAAYALLVPFMRNLDSSPELLQQFVSVQLARGKEDEVYAMLQDRFKHNTLPDSLAEALIDMAVKNRNYALAESVLRTASLEDMPEESLLRYAALAYQQNRVNMALSIKNRLSADYLHSTPLLSAVLNVAGHTPHAVDALLLLPPAAITQPEEKIIVASIFMHEGYAGRAFPMLEQLPISVMLDSADPAQIAEMYLAANAADRGTARLQEALHDASPAIRVNADSALLLLAAGAGQDETVKQWLSKHGAGNTGLLDDAYDVATRHGRPAIALEFAQALYQKTPNEPHRLQLAEALLHLRRYGDAMQYLQAPAQHDVAARSLYMEAMMDWIKQAGTSGVPDSTRKTLESFIDAALRQRDMAPNEKRDMAYLLREMGFGAQAEGVFLELAADKPFASPDTQDLLAFWGEHPSPAAVSWIESRARNASGSEKAAWLAHLNGTGHAKSVVAVLQGGESWLPPILNEYINALLETHDRQRLGSLLAQQIDMEEAPERLKHLTLIATQEDFTSIAEKGWRKVYTRTPNDPDAQKELGLLEYSANHYTQAQPLLEAYMQHNHSDYHVNYAYAEILQHRQKNSQAQAYFNQAQKQVSEMKSKDLSTQLDEAHLLYRNNHLEEALGLYRRLLAQHPDNKALRADFAEMLIETKQYNEASALLSP